MKVFRFMSRKEFEKYLRGETLTNDTIHSQLHGSDAVGFCFLEFKGIEFIRKAFLFLIGLVNTDVLAVFEAPEDYFKKGKATVSDPDGYEEFETMEIEELSCTSYSKDNLKLVDFTYNFDYNESINHIDWFFGDQFN